MTSLKPLPIPPANLSKCSCPETQANCDCTESAVMTRFTLTKTASTILTSMTSGFCLGIALILRPLIYDAIIRAGYAEPYTTILTILTYLGIAVVLLMVVIWINRRMGKLRDIAKTNRYVLDDLK